MATLESGHTMGDQSPAMKAGEDLQGVKKGSRIVPLLMLVVFVVGFVAYAIERTGPDLALMTVESEADIPTTCTNLCIVARVRQEPTLHFRLFDARGTQIATHQTDTAVVASLRPEHTARLNDFLLASLKSTLDGNWDKEGQDISLFDKELITVSVDVLTRYPRSLEDYNTLNIGLMWFLIVASSIAEDFPIILRAHRNTIWVLLLYSLVPGLLGMIYRRAFWKWFVGAFVILFAINWGYDTANLGSIAPVRLERTWTEPIFRFLEEAIVLLLVAFRLRRQSVSAIDQAARRSAHLLAALVFLLAVSAFVYLWFDSQFRWEVLEGAVILLALAYVLVTQTRVEPQADHGKNIVVCLDGTWNQPGQKDFDHVAVTNVFKLFSMCKGKASREHYNASQFKVYPDDETRAKNAKKECAKQIAFYYQGVGNKVDNSELGQLFGGAFGLGAGAIVERAYLDVVKAYRPGDRIFVFGFSRGAAIARLVAGVIGRRGVPMSLWTLRLFGQHWLVWKSAKALDVKVDVLGCWDTVGSFGFSKNVFGIPLQRVNLLKDLTVSLCVKRAYHMVALDETRDSFEPTLMDPDPTAPDRIVEVWFSGNHSNVGGGYATDNLSDVTLDFLLRHISSGYAWDKGQTPGDESWGLHLNAVLKGQSANGGVEGIKEVDPNPRGTIRQSTGPVYSYASRKLPAHAVVYDSVFDRMYDSLPVYAPQSLFDLNQDFVKKRKDIEMEVKRLVETASLEAEGSGRILDWSGRHLSLMKWSRYLKLSLDETTQMKHRLQPAVELRNPPMY